LGAGELQGLHANQVAAISLVFNSYYLYLVVVFYIFLVSCIVQLDIALLFLLRGGRKTLHISESVEVGVSVIICARNEAENLTDNLPHILWQDYPLFEVIVINDGSLDNTDAVLQRFKASFDNLVVINVTDGGKGKKRLLQSAASSARFERILLIDADCKPASDQWLRLMTAPLSGAKEIVAGYGGYIHRPGFLNAFTRWETVHTWLQYSSWGRGGIPYMAVGRNLACTKSCLLRAMASPVWNAIPSGDDDLLVSIAATKENYCVQDNPASFTFTQAKTTWREWYAQKKRHMSTGKFYKDLPKLVLGMYALTHAAGWLLFFYLLFTPATATVFGLWAARCLLAWLALSRAARAVGEGRLILTFPVFDIGWMMYNFALLPYITWKNKTTWT